MPAGQWQLNRVARLIINTNSKRKAACHLRGAHTGHIGCRWCAHYSQASGRAAILCPAVYHLVENGYIAWARILLCTALDTSMARLNTSCKLLRKAQLASAIIPSEMQLPQFQMRVLSNFGELEQPVTCSCEASMLREPLCCICPDR